MSAILVTGTDTNVGKTWVTCAIAQGLRARGRRVGVLKPIETGVTDAPEDAGRLRKAAADDAPLDDICPYRFRAPLAPGVAAALEGVAVDLDRLVVLIARRRTTVDVLLVEGAGGLLVPIAGRATFVDLARAADLPLLIVAANRLGTVNHTALTARVARGEGLSVLGFVLSQSAPVTDESAVSNAATIADLTGLPCLGSLGHGATGPLDVTPFERG